MVANEYIPGQLVVLTDTISNPTNSQLADDSTEALTVYKPDGTTTSPGINHASTGVYNAQLVLDMPGWWEYVFKSTGAAAGAGRGRFFVSPVP